MDWLLGLYYAGMAEYTPGDAELAITLAATETIRAGVTCVVDNWGVCGGDSVQRIAECADASIGAYARSGLRVLFAKMFATRLPEPWRATRVGYDLDRLVTSLDSALSGIETLHATYDRSAGGRITVCPAPELPEMVEAEALPAALALGRRFGSIVAMHLLASPESRDHADAARLGELGALGPELLGAHCTAATEADLGMLRAHGVCVAHCPTASAALGSVTSAGRFHAAGLTVGLGSDNASLNRNSDVLAEARRAMLVSRALGPASTWISGRRAVEMATVDGARAIGMAAELGSLAAGKLADLVVIDTSGAHWWPRHDWLDTLVNQGKSTDVVTVVIDGRVVMQDRVLAWIDADAEHRLRTDAQRASCDILERAGLAAIA